MGRLVSLPQFWLVVYVLAGLILGRLIPIPLPHWLQVLGMVMVGAGILLMALAARTMTRAQTTFMPGQVPAHLVTDGPFRYSRNPIYLGDLLILSGFLLAIEAVPGLIMVPFFAWTLADRFIREEELRIEAEFGDAYRAYKEKVRRWI